MGLIDSHLSSIDHQAKGPGHVVRILLRPTFQSALQAQHPQIDPYRLLIDQPRGEALISDALLGEADIALVEVDPASPTDVARIGDLKARYPDLPVIAAVADPSLSAVRALMRLGVSDVIELPFTIPALASSISDVGATLRGSRSARSQRAGAMISVIKSIGGVGATNVVTHLGEALAQAPQLARGTCLFDLDMQFGNVATYLGLSQTLSISDLIAAGSRIDSELLRTSATILSDRLAVFPAPDQIEPMEAVDQDQLLSLLASARSEYDAIVVDLPSNWSNWTLSVVAHSTLIVVVVNLSIGSLRQGRRQIELLLAQGIAPDRIRVVANRVEKKVFKSIGLDAAARALGVEIDYTIQNDYPLVSGANDQGQPISQINRRSKVAKDFARMGDAIAALLPAIAH